MLGNQRIAPHYTRSVQRLPTPWVSDDGRAQTLEAVVYRPLDAKGPLPTVVFNHGSTGAGNRPAWFTFTWTSPEVAQYFTSKGWQVVFPQRRGRGKSDGLYDEGFGATRSAGYSCQPDRSLPGLDRAITDLDVVMSHLQQRPDADKTRLLIGGVSRGGHPLGGLRGHAAWHVPRRCQLRRRLVGRGLQGGRCRRQPHGLRARRGLCPAHAVAVWRA